MQYLRYSQPVCQQKKTKYKHNFILLTNSILSKLLLDIRLLIEADVYTNRKEEGEIRRKRQCLFTSLYRRNRGRLDSLACM